MAEEERDNSRRANEIRRRVANMGSSRKGEEPDGAPDGFAMPGDDPVPAKIIRARKPGGGTADDWKMYARVRDNAIGRPPGLPPVMEWPPHKDVARITRIARERDLTNAEIQEQWRVIERQYDAKRLQKRAREINDWITEYNTQRRTPSEMARDALEGPRIKIAPVRNFFARFPLVARIMDHDPIEKYPATHNDPYCNLRFAFLIDPQYNNSTAYDSIKRVNHNRIHTMDGGRVQARGRNVLALHKSSEESMRLLLMEAEARGWTSIKLKGSKKFCELAKKLANETNLKVTVQREIRPFYLFRYPLPFTKDEVMPGIPASGRFRRSAGEDSNLMDPDPSGQPGDGGASPESKGNIFSKPNERTEPPVKRDGSPKAAQARAFAESATEDAPEMSSGPGSGKTDTPPPASKGARIFDKKANEPRVRSPRETASPSSAATPSSIDPDSEPDDVVPSSDAMDTPAPAEKGTGLLDGVNPLGDGNRKADEDRPKIKSHFARSKPDENVSATGVAASTPEASISTTQDDSGDGAAKAPRNKSRKRGKPKGRMSRSSKKAAPDTQQGELNLPDKTQQGVSDPPVFKGDSADKEDRDPFETRARRSRNPAHKDQPTPSISDADPSP